VARPQRRRMPPVGIEVSHVDHPIVVVDGEVGLPKPGREPARAIRDRRRDVNQLDAATEPERFLAAQPHGQKTERCRTSHGERHATSTNGIAHVRLLQFAEGDRSELGRSQQRACRDVFVIARPILPVHDQMQWHNVTGSGRRAFSCMSIPVLERSSHSSSLELRGQTPAFCMDGRLATVAYHTRAVGWPSCVAPTS
jgi:hypothetical protein